jgi:hypothetical protein
MTMTSQRTKAHTLPSHTKPTHKSLPCKRACLVPTLPGHTLPRLTTLAETQARFTQFGFSFLSLAEKLFSLFRKSL